MQGASHSKFSSTPVDSSSALAQLHRPAHGLQLHLVFRPDAFLYALPFACQPFLHPTAHLKTSQFSGKAQPNATSLLPTAGTSSLVDLGCQPNCI